MKPEQIRIAVAEECGYVPMEMNKREKLPLSLCAWCKPDETAVSFAGLPNYDSDLNACHEMEKTLTSTERLDYMEFVAPVTLDWPVETWALTHATALQRCEAFLRVKGRWVE